MEMDEMVRNKFHVIDKCNQDGGDGEYTSKIIICLEGYQLFVE